MECMDIADRRPIDPPPVVQLRVIDKGARARSRRSSSPDEQCVSPLPTLSLTVKNPLTIPDSAHYNQSFLQNPYYFMYASLASPERDEELHLLKDNKTRCTTGSVVSSLYHLKDPEADGEWFFFCSVLFCFALVSAFRLRSLGIWIWILDLDLDLNTRARVRGSNYVPRSWKLLHSGAKLQTRKKKKAGREGSKVTVTVTG